MKVYPNSFLAVIAISAALVIPVTAEEIGPETVLIEAGPFLMGSTREEKEYGYKLDEAAYGHSVTRNQKWYENEADEKTVELPAYRISSNLITNADYAKFVADTGHPAPKVSKTVWNSYGLIHPYERTLKFQWPGSVPSPERQDHPVVLLDHNSAVAYTNWLSQKTGKSWRLPTAEEWEKAARGTEGRIFPWGNGYDATKLNSHDNGPFDTVSVGQFPAGVSPYGLHDAAGQVFEWTATPAGADRFVVKGGSWDDKGCGVCRAAAWHTRPVDLKHILVGFRVVKEEEK
ncbi:MAG: formylglycine-generating enzyme family protein [Proteobacteria bacterium]|nr:formylglycine-generating enzyme family protein [Pseudomonadota bacterium]